MPGVLLVIIITLVVVAGYRLIGPKFKGAVGESRVNWQLRRLAGEEYKVFSDVLLRTHGGSSQIDHLVVSIYGIFVIETKNYKGWIHGHEKSEYWTQSIFRTKTQFRNPISQNWAHVYALKEVLSDFDQITYHPIVVFAGTAELKNVYTRTPVVYDYELFRTVLDRSGAPNLTIEQVTSIARRLNEVSMQSRREKKEHVYRARKYAFDRIQKEGDLICPRCGGSLTLRDGRYGEFYGCFNYPKCRYTKSN